MNVINTYLYPNTLCIQILDTTVTNVRNRQVYSRPIKIYQGIDNPIQISIKNQDQKSIDLTGYSVQVDIQDPTNKVTVISYGVAWTGITVGQGMITIDEATVNSLEQRFYKLTTRTIRHVDNAETPAYIDDNYGVLLDLEVLPAYYAITEPSPYVDNSVIDGGLL
jgi:hypothetical protein